MKFSLLLLSTYSLYISLKIQKMDLENEDQNYDKAF